MRIRGMTDIGQVRETNQDCFYIHIAGKWCMIADGMGGHNGGETASKMAVELICNTLEDNVLDIEENISAAINNANKEILKLSMINSSLSGMGTTAVVCYFHGTTAIIANVGDSRAYHISDGQITQITKDHSVVQQLIDIGTITKEQAKSHPQRNLITRAIGTDDVVEIDITKTIFKKGDFILLCTDGLTSFINDDTILETVLNNDIDDAIREMIKLANNSGGTDNITTILIEI